MSLHQRIIEQLDEDLFRSDISWDTAATMLNEAGWFALQTRRGHHKVDGDPVYVVDFAKKGAIGYRIHILYTKDRLTGQQNLVRASGSYSSDFQNHLMKNAVWFVKNLNTPVGIQRLEELANQDPEEWSKGMQVYEKIDYSGGRSPRARGAWGKKPRQSIKPGTMNVLGAVRQAILEILGPLMVGSKADKEELVYTSTFLPEEDPGERYHDSSNAAVIVYHDVPHLPDYEGLPPAYGHIVSEEPSEDNINFPVPSDHYWVSPVKTAPGSLMDVWRKVGDRAAELSGKKAIWNEPWDNAVSGMYVRES